MDVKMEKCPTRALSCDGLVSHGVDSVSSLILTRIKSLLKIKEGMNMLC